MALLASSPVLGPVRLKPPTNEFYILEDYGAIDCVDRSKLPLQHVYFGLFVSEGARRLVRTTVCDVLTLHHCCVNSLGWKAGFEEEAVSGPHFPCPRAVPVDGEPSDGQTW